MRLRYFGFVTRFIVKTQLLFKKEGGACLFPTDALNLNGAANDRVRDLSNQHRFLMKHWLNKVLILAVSPVLLQQAGPTEEYTLYQKLAATGVLASYFCQKERGVHTEETINTSFAIGVERLKLNPEIFADKKVAKAAVAYLDKFVNADCTRKPGATNQAVMSFLQPILED